MTRFANCTVPLIYKAQQLVKIFGLSDEFIARYLATTNRTNSTTNGTSTASSASAASASASFAVDVELNSGLALQLGTFIEQFDKCYRDLQTDIQLPVPKFVRLWQQIVSFTCYTVAAFYGFSSAFFTYRMQKLHVLSPRSLGSAAVIVGLGIFFGLGMGFFLGCLPAALLAQIYAAIPHNLPQSVSWVVAFFFSQLSCPTLRGREREGESERGRETERGRESAARDTRMGACWWAVRLVCR